MTEEEWLACAEPYTILLHMSRVPGSDQFKNRKTILFAAACCSRLPTSSHSRVEKLAIDWLLAKADAEPTKQEKQAVLVSLERAAKRRSPNERDAVEAIRTAVSETRISNFYAAAWQIVKRICRAKALGDKELENKEDRLHCDYLRDIFGNPFRTVTLDPSWLTSTVIALAQQMYDSRDFSAMPILADALQDAGCDNAQTLEHCRGPGPHVRGCFVVDFALGRK